MRILFCIPSLEYGGAERRVCHVARELTKGGHDIHVACGRRGPYANTLLRGGATVHDVGGKGNHDAHLLRNLVRLVRRLKPDVVNTSLTQMDVGGGASALLTRTPWVLSESSAAPSYPRGWKSSLRVQLGRRASAIVSNSMEGDAYWSGVSANRRHIITNGVPLAEIDALPSLPADVATVLFAGRMDAGKDAGTVVAALRQIADDIPFVAVLCGDGPCRADLQRTTAQYGLCTRIQFPGYVADLWERMKAAQVFVSLSRYEGCPNVVLEAMASGCPLVVSDIAAHRAILNESSASFVPVGDAAAAAAAIRTTLSVPEAARRQAQNAHAQAASHSIASMAQAYEAIFETVRRATPVSR